MPIDWKALAKDALDRLQGLEEVRYDQDDNEWHWRASGEPLQGQEDAND